MMDRHGDDFAAMERDPDNIFQLTANKIRRRVTKFISVPEQFENSKTENALIVGFSGPEYAKIRKFGLDNGAGYVPRFPPSPFPFPLP